MAPITTSQKNNPYLFSMVVPAYPAFNIYSRIAATTTALGPLSVATSVDRMPNWKAEVVDENNFRRRALRGDDRRVDHRTLQNLHPARVVGLYGGLTSTIPRLYSIARTYKDMGAITVAGGQHFNDETIAEAFDSGIDYVVTGEGEVAIQELLSAIGNNQDTSHIEGLVMRRDGAIVKNAPRAPLLEFDGLPLADFSLVRHARISMYPVERIRGCGMNCEFCTVKGTPRPAPPERLIEQISRLVETRGARNFFIVDDLFGQQRDETIRFCTMLRDYQDTLGVRLNLTAQIRLDKARDTELLEAMRRARINHVAIGFESPVKEDLLAMHKHLKQEDMVSLVRTYRRNGFFIHGMFIFGYPSAEDTPINGSLNKRVAAYRRFIREAKIDTIQILLPVPLPGTELRERLRSSGRIYNQNVVGWEFYDGNFPLFRPDSPYSAQRLQHDSQRIMSGFYRFIHIFVVGFHILAFSSMLFSLHDIGKGWKKWHHRWRNSLVRFGGYLTLTSWRSDLRRNHFSVKLERAQAVLGKGA